MKSLIRIVHLFSSMLVCSAIISNYMFDLRKYDIIDNPKYKKLNHYAGLTMIFSGIFLLVSMKKKFATAEERVWMSFFSLKFVMSISVTPFVVSIFVTNQSYKYFFSRTD